MTEHPDFLNVRKLFFMVAAGPIALLLFFSLLDVSWHRLGTWQSATALCAQTAVDTTIKPQSTACPK